MKLFKNIKIALIIILLSLTNITYAETLKFGSSTYEGEVKKGKAHGVGIVTFADGSKYEGKFKRNRIHGKGKFTDSDNNVFEGKFRRGKFVNKIDKKTKEIIQLNVETGVSSSFEIKGTGLVFDKWFEAEKTSSGTFVLTTKGAKDMKKAEAKALSGGGSSDSGGGGGGGGGC
mgnify:CR=1 FL=1|tara:strand:- start:150 stop:668 length:519 start_codon:yes stop_codon:yes gene_type:complete